MKSLSRIQTIIFAVSGVCVIVGALLWSVYRTAGIVLFCAGSLGVASMQMLMRYEGRDVAVRRLRAQQILAGILLMVTGAMMIVQEMHLGYLFRNEWMVAFAIAALLECYTAFRLPYALRKAEEDK